jgi:hypothetical protein
MYILYLCSMSIISDTENKDLPYKKMTKEELDKIVNYVMHTYYPPKADMGDVDTLRVYQDETTLAFTIGAMSTGIKGFKMLVDMSPSMFVNIIFNGKVLSDESTKQFWEQWEEISKRLDDEEL